MIEGWMMWKIIGIAACGVGAYGTWRSMPVPNTRAKLGKVFQLGQLGIKRKNGKHEGYLYPTIHRVRIFPECIQAIFTIPAGFDPAEIHKHKWLFLQVFGPYITLDGDHKTFTLTIYPNRLESFDYDYNALQPHLNGLRLPIVAGRSRTGWEVYDMCQYPHLLIAGITDSGKSVSVRNILTTLILSGADLELYCGDLKRSEFHLFQGIGEVVYDELSLYKMLKPLREELARRGELLNAHETDHIDHVPDKPHYIVIAIDEVALLHGNEKIMSIIDDIAAAGRALGMYLILSMQRPDAEVLNSRLKSNLGVRMAFRHADELNSRITLGSGEAAHIKASEKGKMMLSLDGLKEVQAPYLDLKKARKMLEPYKKPLPKQEPEEEDVLNVL